MADDVDRDRGFTTHGADPLWYVPFGLLDGQDDLMSTAVDVFNREMCHELDPVATLEEGPGNVSYVTDVTTILPTGPVPTTVCVITLTTSLADRLKLGTPFSAGDLPGLKLKFPEHRRIYEEYAKEVADEHAALMQASHAPPAAASAAALADVTAESDAAGVQPPPSELHEGSDDGSAESVCAVFHSSASQFSAKAKRPTIAEVEAFFGRAEAKRHTTKVTLHDGTTRVGYQIKNYVVFDQTRPSEEGAMAAFPTAESVNNAPWSMWQTANDGNDYELLADSPGVFWCYSTTKRVEFAHVKNDLGKLDYQLKPPPVERPTLQFTVSAKRGKSKQPKRDADEELDESSDMESSHYSESSGAESSALSDSEHSKSTDDEEHDEQCDEDCRKLLMEVVESEDPTKHNASELLCQSIRAFQRSKQRVQSTANQLNSRKDRRNSGSKKGALIEKLDLLVETRNDRHGAVKVALMNELRTLTFPDGEALQLKLAIGPKRLRKAIDRLNMSGETMKDDHAEISETSYAYAMEDEEFTVDQSLMGATAKDSTYRAALSSRMDGNSGTETSGADDGSDSGGDESSDEEGYSAPAETAETEALRSKSAMNRELMAAEEKTNRVRMETALRRDAYLRLTSPKHQSRPFPLEEFLYKLTKKRTSRGDKEATVPTKAVLEKFFVDLQNGENGARPFVHNQKGENMDYATWFCEEVWDRGLRELLGGHTHTVLQILNQLMEKYVFKKEALDEMAADHKRIIAQRGAQATKLRVSVVIRGDESGPLKPLKERDPAAYTKLRMNRTHVLANIDTWATGHTYTQIIERLLYHSTKYYADWMKLAEWERNLSREASKYSGITMPQGMDKHLKEVDGGRRLLEAIDRTDMGGLRAPGVRSSVLSRIHMALWHGDAALTVVYRKDFRDGQFQDGANAIATEEDWLVFQDWFAENHTRLFHKSNGLLGKSRKTEYSGAQPSAPGYSNAGRNHMKDDAARKKFAAKPRATSQNYYKNAIYKGSHDALKRMATDGVAILDNTGKVRIAKLTEEIIGTDLQKWHKVRTIQGLREQREKGTFKAIDPALADAGGAVKPTKTTPKLRKVTSRSSQPSTHEWGETVDCTLRITYDDVGNRPKLDDAEKFLSSIEKQPEVMQKYQLRQADIAKVRERLKKQLPTDLALNASQIDGTGVKCSICAPTDWGKRLHRALQCQNCETHEQGSCHMMVAKELFPNSDFVRRIAEVFWFRLISSLYPRRPRWGKKKSKDAAAREMLAKWREENPTRG